MLNKKGFFKGWVVGTALSWGIVLALPCSAPAAFTCSFAFSLIGGDLGRRHWR